MCDQQNEFSKLNTRVFVISFGTLPAVQEWLKETCGNFTVLLDRERTIYNTYGLERSKLRSKSPRTLWLYFTRWLQGQKFHDSHGDDTSQLGGDFIIDRNGKLRFIYPSHDPADRPSVEKLLAVLKQIKP
ncbi:MAG: AhpC/TSA family protein [Anaerolineales bacterium]|nr:AhpC/TSA family protein [Chloroflexota bacterium]MBK6645590.1 AhpC/TSA family protein [Anaerolineales bacterium]